MIMNKKLIVLSIALASSQVSAMELYNSQGTTFDIGGKINADFDYEFGDGSRETLELDTDGRVFFEGKQVVGQGWSAEGMIELGFAHLTRGDSDEDNHIRLGYVGLGSDNWGRFRFGKQESTYYQAIAITDQPIAFSSEYYGEVGGVDAELGLKRPDDTFSYEYRFGSDVLDGLRLGLSWADVDGNDDADNEFQGYLGYFDPEGVWTLDASFAVAEEVNLFGLGLAYGQFDQEGWFGAVTANFGDSTEESGDVAFELLGSYRWDNTATLSLAYENASADGDVEYVDAIKLNLQYDMTNDLIAYSGFRFDLDDDSEKHDFKVGLEYYL